MKNEFDKKKGARSNELYALSKVRPLTPEEAEEQAGLRKEYLAWFRAGLRGETKKGEDRCTRCRTVLVSDA